VSVGLFRKGERLTTDNLNPVAVAAKRAERAFGAVGGGVGTPGTPAAPEAIVVIASAVSQAAKLSDHQYTVRNRGGQEWTLDPTRLIVPVEPALIEASTAPGGRPMAFWPAAVRGDAVAAVASWRARGVLYRFTGEGGAPDHAAVLFGLCPARGC